MAADTSSLKRLSINADYIYNFSRSEESSYVNPLSIGIVLILAFSVDVFQRASANEPGFISNAEGDWSQRSIYFGFHIKKGKEYFNIENINVKQR